LRQLRDLGFLVRSLVVVIAEVSLLAAFVYYCALAVTGGHDSGGMPATGGEVAFLGFVLVVQLIVAATVWRLTRGRRAAQKLRAVSWWLIPFGVVGVFLLVA
jgi:hypothetical protein